VRDQRLALRLASGMISLEARRERLVPMLVERARTRLSG